MLIFYGFVVFGLISVGSFPVFFIMKFISFGTFFSAFSIFEIARVLFKQAKLLCYYELTFFQPKSQVLVLFFKVLFFAVYA